MIDTFSFGNIVIDGRKYVTDLIIFPDGRVMDSWRRKSGHRLSVHDLTSLIQSEPEVIVAGTGVSGLVRLEEGLEIFLSQKGIKFISAPNEKAIESYNDLLSKKRVGACFHLTC